MGRKFEFFALPEEFWSLVHTVRLQRGLRLWTLRDGRLEAIDAAPDQVFPWPPGIALGNTSDPAWQGDAEAAMNVHGFVMLLSPKVDDSRAIFLAEIGTSATGDQLPGSLLGPLRRALDAMMVGRTEAVSRRAPDAPGVPGPKYTHGALEFHRAGGELRQEGAANVLYLPR